MPRAEHSAVTRHRLRVVPPYRLDLTVFALRRLSTNVVDLWRADGTYLRALDSGGVLVVEVRQPAPERLALTLAGPAGEHAAALATVRRMLGVDRDLRRFARAASRLPWLGPIARRMRGVRPPRYPSLFEAAVNAVLYQQVSLAAASAITRRFILEFGRAVPHEGAILHTFPSPDAVHTRDDARLLAAGISRAKVATLHRLVEAIASGTLDSAALELLPSDEAAATLRRVKGIGPWTAALILLRGLGRLDVFPADDSGVARNLAFVGAGHGAPAALEALGADRGMLYFCLLLARLEASGELGRPSVALAPGAGA